VHQTDKRFFRRSPKLLAQFFRINTSFPVNVQATEIAGALLEGGKSRPVVFTRVGAGS